MATTTVATNTTSSTSTTTTVDTFLEASYWHGANFDLSLNATAVPPLVLSTDAEIGRAILLCTGGMIVGMCLPYIVARMRRVYKAKRKKQKAKEIEYERRRQQLELLSEGSSLPFEEELNQHQLPDYHREVNLDEQISTDDSVVASVYDVDRIDIDNFVVNEGIQVEMRMKGRGSVVIKDGNVQSKKPKKEVQAPAVLNAAYVRDNEDERARKEKDKRKLLEKQTMVQIPNENPNAGTKWSPKVAHRESYKAGSPADQKRSNPLLDPFRDETSPKDLLSKAKSDTEKSLLKKEKKAKKGDGGSKRGKIIFKKRPSMETIRRSPSMQAMQGVFKKKKKPPKDDSQ